MRGELSLTTMKITRMITAVALATGMTHASVTLLPHGANNWGVTGITTYGTGASDDIINLHLIYTELYAA